MFYIMYSSKNNYQDVRAIAPAQEVQDDVDLAWDSGFHVSVKAHMCRSTTVIAHVEWNQLWDTTRDNTEGRDKR